MSKATFTFGRFNPPTEEGHGKLVSAVQQHAEKTGGVHYIFPSHSQDAKKNPLSHDEKSGAMRKLFPNANIVSHGKVRTAIDAMKHLEKKGHTNVTMVVGSDRVKEFHGLLSKYRKKEFPGIKKVNVVSAGNRDPDAEGAEGMSASKLRGLVAAGKKDEFISHYSDKKLGAHIHDKVKAGMQMKESVNPVGIFLLGGPGSGKDYVLKNIFSRFDLTEVHSDQILSRKASELTESKKNIVINGVSDLERIGEIQSFLEGYDFDYVHVSVTNKVSRLRNGLREQPLAENKRIDKWLKAEKLAEKVDCFNFNNSINLNESNELEQVMFASQIEHLLSRLVNHGLELKESAESKSFTLIRRLTEQMKGDLKVPHTVDAIAAKHNVSVAVIIQALTIGKQVEMEHTNDENTAENIALAHLWEKPDYYTQLAKMEQVAQITQVDHAAAERKTERERRIRDTRYLTHQNRHVHDAAKGSMSEAIRRVPRSGNVTAVMDKRELNDAERLGFEQAKIQLATSKVKEEKDFPAVKKDKESGLPKKYVAGLSTSTAKARASHWKEKANLSDSDPRAYEPAPGDATAKTKVSRYTKKYHDMYGEASSPAQQAAIAISMKKAGKKPKNEEVQLDEGAADTSLAGKAKKSGISVGTLRKVYNRGVAAWNSGHRPGTTPQQWGHARVNSYITKGKTYHTADKDLHEETEDLNLDTLFEMQLVGTDEYRKHAIAMTPGQSQEIANAFSDDGKINVDDVQKTESECECGGNCKCDGEDGSGNSKSSRKFSELRKEAKEKDGKDDGVETQPTLTAKHKKAALKAPNHYDYTLQGMPVTARFNALEQTQVDTKDEVQLDEISSKPPSAAKKLKNFLKTPRQIPAPKGGHPVPPGYERVHDVLSGGTVLRKLKESSELTLEEAVQYHLDNNISITENVFRPGSDKFFELMSEAKRLYKEGAYEPADEYEKQMLESDIGEIAEYEGQLVVLDFPIEEGLEECWTGYTQKGMKKKGNKMVPNCVPVNEEDKTDGKGIGKPWRTGGGGAVYVRTGDGGVKKVNFSQSGMKKKFMDPAATRSFVARHHCLTNKDKTSASYWACRYPRFFSNSGKIWW